MLTRRSEERDRESLRNVYYQSRKRTFTWLDAGKLGFNDFDRDTVGESIWVCENHAEVVGFVSAEVTGRFIHHLFVLPEFSKNGFGSELLKTCLAEIGFPAQLKCVTANTQALSFYQSRGWETLSKAVGVDGEYHLMEVYGK